MIANLCQSPGKWLLRFPGNIWSYTRGLHMARATIHGSRACLSFSGNPTLLWASKSQRMDQTWLDLSCKRYAHLFVVLSICIITSRPICLQGCGFPLTQTLNPFSHSLALQT